MPRPQNSDQRPDQAEALTGVESVDDRDPTVLELLGISHGGKPKPTRRTLIVMLENDPQWKGLVRRDRFRNTVLLDGAPLDDETVTRVAYRMEEVGSDNGFHVVQDWAARLRWDGVERLPTLLEDHFGAPGDELTRAVSRIWLVGGAARIMEPGCKLDTVTILVGGQGIGKSRACRALMPQPDWFADTSLHLGSKDAMQNLGGVWLYELAVSRRTNSSHPSAPSSHSRTPRPSSAYRLNAVGLPAPRGGAPPHRSPDRTHGGTGGHWRVHGS